MTEYIPEYNGEFPRALIEFEIEEFSTEEVDQCSGCGKDFKEGNRAVHLRAYGNPFTIDFELHKACYERLTKSVPLDATVRKDS